METENKGDQKEMETGEIDGRTKGNEEEMSSDDESIGMYVFENNK